MMTTIKSDTVQGEVHVLDSWNPTGGVYATTRAYILKSDVGCSPKLLLLTSPFYADAACVLRDHRSVSIGVAEHAWQHQHRTRLVSLLEEQAMDHMITIYTMYACTNCGSAVKNIFFLVN